ncbi:hypothetical protein SCLCIDRAFT_101191 [Scleroderma citrinum Foug A]|uniref:PX domain-containing protein n=1 Tax=Scleroderma citrinum Foug A TaxID=1036808 RepID=A0A0C3ERF7_9AGAM|nr:hypothetical protein SCLCIDRAFT_101191 [Scleroderma citrinum Foug A]
MAAPPPVAKQISALFSPSERLPPDDDIGINSSGASWAEHLDHAPLSEDETEGASPEFDIDIRPARALYDFEGNAEYQEMTVRTGDEIEVLREDAGEGWSLVRTLMGEIGLLPATYYTYTPDLISALSEQDETHTQGPETSVDPSVPYASSKGKLDVSLVPQHTGESRNILPGFRQRSLGGKFLNRFSSFVTSGAEEWVIKGCPDISADNPASAQGSHSRFSSIDTLATDSTLGEADKHFIDTGPSWQPKTPKFRVLVHSPSKRTSGLTSAYTVYSVTSSFPLDHVKSTEPSEPSEPFGASPATLITVQRRFSHFAVLHTVLTRRLPGIALPPLPEKQYTGRFSADFIEARRADLEQYINRIVRHPVARYAEVITSFLGCEDELEWSRQIPRFLSMPVAGPSFFARVFHPAFNIDVYDAVEVSEMFNKHIRAVGRGIQGLRNVFGQVRDARLHASMAEKSLSHSLLSLITAKTSSDLNPTGEEDSTPNMKGVVNDEGAWCWRDSCKGCLKATKAIQKVGGALQGVARLYDDHSRRTMLATHQSLKGLAHPHMVYQGIIEIHRATATRCAEAVQNESDPEMISRCETVLNATMAEMDTYHDQKLQDIITLVQEHLDDEIALYEQILSRLKSARRGFDPPHFDDLSRSPCIERRIGFQKDLERLTREVDPLPQPSPHVYDGVTIQDSVGVLLGGSSRTVGSTSVLSKLWA